MRPEIALVGPVALGFLWPLDCPAATWPLNLSRGEMATYVFRGTPVRNILSSAQIADAVRRYQNGETMASIGKRFDVTLQAIWMRLNSERLGEKGIQELRRLRHENVIMRARFKRSERQRKAANVVIRLLQPSRKRRSLFVPLLQAKYGFSHRDCNQLVAISKSAGENPGVSRVDRLLVEMMRTYLQQHPNAGFPQLFNVVKHGQPGSRSHALDLYRFYFGSRVSRKDLRSTKVPKVRKMPIQAGLNQVWSMDFMQGALPNGNRFWVLTTIDDCNREAVIAKVLKRRSASAVVGELSNLISHGRVPVALRTDHGGEFKSLVYKTWAEKTGITRMYARPHTPADNCHIEQFNGALRYDVLTRFDYRSLEEAQQAIDDWCLHYNYVRPQAAFGGLSPMQYAHLIGRNPSNTPGGPVHIRGDTSFAPRRCSARDLASPGAT